MLSFHAGSVLRVLGCVVLCGLMSAAQAQSWPARPVHLIVPDGYTLLMYVDVNTIFPFDVKAHRREQSYASPGSGSPQHLGMEIIRNAYGMDNSTSASPTAFRAMLKDEVARWAPVVKAAGIQPE